MCGFATVFFQYFLRSSLRIHILFLIPEVRNFFSTRYYGNSERFKITQEIYEAYLAGMMQQKYADLYLKFTKYFGIKQFERQDAEGIMFKMLQAIIEETANTSFWADKNSLELKRQQLLNIRHEAEYHIECSREGCSQKKIQILKTDSIKCTKRCNFAETVRSAFHEYHPVEFVS